MNMTAYQEFRRIFDFVAGNDSNTLLGQGIDKRMPILRKKYAKMGYGDASDEAIMLMERKKLNQNNREVGLFIQSAQVFELDDKHKYLLMRTNNPRLEDKDLWEHVRLPFPEMFIDTEFTNEDFDEMNNVAKISGILLKEMKQFGVSVDSDKKNISKSQIYGLTAYVCGLTVEGFPFMEKIHFPIQHDKEDKVVYEDKKEADFIKKFVINFILFLKDREVIYVHSERSAKNQERRVKDGKMALPSSRVIKLTGALKRYVDSLQENDFRGKLSGSWWVSGHWRTYRSAKYTNVRDKVQWIEPFRKGSGFEIKHTYRVVPNDEDDTLNYDDIEAGKKKLKNIAR